MDSSDSTGTALLARSRAGTGLTMLKRRALLQAPLRPCYIVRRAKRILLAAATAEHPLKL